MDITYLGHSCFKLKTTSASLITDPYSKSVGFTMSRVSADIVTVSHSHEDHNEISLVTPTSRRNRPFIIDAAGEYEVGGVSVFGIHTYHDNQEGAIRGENLVFSILMDDISVVHLGDLGHTLKQSQLSALGTADVLLCPVGGHYTIDTALVADLVSQFEPSILIPMHYKTPEHDQGVYGALKTVDEFLKEFGSQATMVDKLSVSRATMPEEMEIIVLNK